MKPLQKIKVAFNGSCLDSGQVGGWSRYTSELINHLKKYYADKLDIFVFQNTTQQMHTFWEQVTLPKLCFKNSIDILHAPANAGLPIQGSFKKVLTIHDLFSEKDFSFRTSIKSFQNFKAALRYQLDWRTSIRAADLVITVSDFSKNELLNYGVTKPITRIYEGTHFKFGKPSEANKRSYLLYVGTFDTRKQTDLLIIDFLKTNADVDLVLIGRSAGQQSRRFSSDRLFFLENISDDQLASYYASALAFITYSKAEGFGLPLVEAMHFGKPVLYTGGGAIPEVVGEAGINISNTGLETILHQLMSQPLDLANLKDKALKQSKKFSWDVAAGETYLAYLNLVNSSKKSATTDL